MAVLGHELRNPLAPRMTGLRLLRMKGIHADELSVMERQVDALVRLADDLMDVPRITRGKIDSCPRRQVSTVTSSSPSTSGFLRGRCKTEGVSYRTNDLQD